jgi:hypothetical protein
VFLPNIPIDPKDYENNQELLTAMMAVHLEATLTHKFINEENLTEDEAQDLS